MYIAKFSQVSSTLKAISILIQCWLKCLLHWNSVSPSAVSRTEACGHAGRLLPMAGRLLAWARRLLAGLGRVSAFSTARHTAPSTQYSQESYSYEWWGIVSECWVNYCWDSDGWVSGTMRTYYCYSCLKASVLVVNLLVLFLGLAITGNFPRTPAVNLLVYLIGIFITG